MNTLVKQKAIHNSNIIDQNVVKKEEISNVENIKPLELRKKKNQMSSIIFTFFENALDIIKFDFLRLSEKIMSKKTLKSGETVHSKEVIYKKF